MVQTTRPFFEVSFWDMTERQRGVAVGVLIAASVVEISAFILFGNLEVVRLPDQWRYMVNMAPLLAGLVIYMMQRYGWFK